MRTKNSIINATSSLILNLIVGILGFLKVSVFIDGFSTDIYSLHQLFFQIMGYIAIADVGFGLLLNKSLYKALAKNDKNEVNNIYSTSKKFYFYIGTFMLLIAFVLSFFLDFFTKADISNLYMQIVFIIFAIRNVIDYFFVAPKYVLESDQKYYIINHLVKGIRILETIVEILLVLAGVNYLLVLIPGIVISLIMNILINKKIYKMYDWLEDKKTFDKEYLKGTKDVVVQKLTGLANSNTDILLLSTFVNSISVVIYTSYTYITKFLIDTVYTIATSITPSFANLLNKEETDKTYSVYRELNSIFLFVATFVTIMLYGLFNSFITLWIGNEYLVNKITLFMFSFIAFQKIAERSTIITINSKGLFKETKPVIIFETILNILLSLFLIRHLGILGVLIGTVFAKLIGTNLFEPIIIHKYVFKRKIFSYFTEYIFNICLLFVGVLILNNIKVTIKSFISWIIYAIILGSITLIILLVVYSIFSKTLRSSITRILDFIKVKVKRKEIVE